VKYYIIAGEASGDLHASFLMEGILKHDINANFRFWGGDLMKKYSPNLVKHYKDLAFMGFTDVLKNIGKIYKNIKLCKHDILNFAPDCVIFVDYPGFNLRIAEFTKKNNIKNFYYISPKIWAWKKRRVKKIIAYIDKMFVIFPFEIDFYKNFNYQQVIYTGNPNIEIIEKKKQESLSRNIFLGKNNLPDKKIIAILAGSRKQEVKRLLPEMLKIVPDFNDFQFIIAGISSLDKKNYTSAEQFPNVRLIFDQTYNLLQNSEAAIVTSGTATLETALFEVPQVVCYKTEPLFYILAKILVRIKFISLVNIILNKKTVEEIIQKKLPERINIELTKLLYDNAYKRKMLNDYQTLKDLLGEKGSPERTSQIIVNSISL
jgi:lipid-A-disaccharide synthase